MISQVEVDELKTFQKQTADFEAQLENRVMQKFDSFFQDLGRYFRSASEPLVFKETLPSWITQDKSGDHVGNSPSVEFRNSHLHPVFGTAGPSDVVQPSPFGELRRVAKHEKKAKKKADKAIISQVRQSQKSIKRSVFTRHHTDKVCFLCPHPPHLSPNFRQILSFIFIFIRHGNEEPLARKSSLPPVLTKNCTAWLAFVALVPFFPPLNFYSLPTTL